MKMLKDYLVEGGREDLIPLMDEWEKAYHADEDRATIAYWEVRDQHPELMLEEAYARAGYRWLTMKYPQAKKLEVGSQKSDFVPPISLPRWAIIAWGILVLLMLGVLAARAESPRFATTNLRHFAFTVPSGILYQVGGGPMIRVQDEGSTIKTWAAGMAVLNFTGGGITCTAAGNVVTCNVPTGGGGASLDAITAALGAATINNGDNAIVWNWQATTADRRAFSFGENTASTASGNPVLLNVQTLAGSTAHPFQVTARGTSNGIRVDAATGSLGAIGAANINATQYKGEGTPTNTEFSYLSGVTSAIQTQFTGKVPTTRNINTTSPLGGGGALSGDLTLTCTGCLTSVTAHALLGATHSDTLAGSVVLGDIISGNSTPAWQRVAGNTTTTKNFLTQTGNGSVSALPTWGTIAAGDVPSLDAAKITTGIFSGARGGTNNGFFEVSGPATATKTFTFPNANATIEYQANKDAASGYAGLTAGTKLNAAQGQEVWGVTDLTDYASTSGTGTTAIRATITSPAANDVLTWSGTNWINQTPSGGSNHNILSSTHSDSTPGTVQRADLITGQGATPTWARLAKGTASQCLQMDGTATDVVWGSCAGGGSNHNWLSATHPDTVAGSPVLGDIPYANSTPAWTKLGGNTTTTKKFLTQTGNGSVSAAPTWDTIAGADLPATVVQTSQGNTYSTGNQNMAAATSFEVPTAAGAGPTVDGGVAYDTTQDTFKHGGAGGITASVPRILATFFCNSTACTCVGTGCTAGTYTTNCISGGADSNCTNAGTTETNFGMNFSVPANFLIANKLLRVTMSYEWTTTSSPPSFRLRMKLNTTNVYDNSALALAGSMTSRGAGAAFLIQGTAAPGASVNVETAITSIGSRIIGLTTEGNTIAQPVAIATNAAQTLQFSLQLGTATAGNFVRLRQLIVEELN